MTNSISPHPNPPYLKSDGTLNASGQLKLYTAGTSNAKVAYSDAAGTSYGSTINLNSSGLPESGPIYFADDALYKIEVYTRTDDVPTYALDYTVDNFGEVPTSLSVSFITADTTWTVDGVGAGADEYTTLAAALAASKDYTIVGDSVLTISIDNGTYANETALDFSHAQASSIKIVGESEAGVILTNTAGSTDWMTFGSLSSNQATHYYFENITFDYSSASASALPIFYLLNASVTANNCTFNIGANAAAVSTNQSSSFVGNDLTFTTDSAAAGSAETFISAYGSSTVTLNGTTTFDHNLTNGTFYCVQVTYNAKFFQGGSYVITAIAGATVYGFYATSSIPITIGILGGNNTATVTNVDYLYFSDYQGKIRVDITGYLDGTGNSTYTSVTTPYSETRIGNGFQTGAGVVAAAAVVLTTATTYYQVTFGTEDYDLGGDFASNTFTCPIAGRYLMVGAVNFDTVADGDVLSVQIKVAGTVRAQVDMAAGGATNNSVPVSFTFDCAKSDAITVWVSNLTTAADDTSGGATTNFFRVEYLGS